MKPLLLTEQAPDWRGFMRRLVAATGFADFPVGNHHGGLRGRFARGGLNGALVLQFRTDPPPEVPNDLREVAEKFERRLGLK
jgi:hypothetical protein